jgi:NAD(P)-dependent dehydrogenase (short-subunit alcohol dehydrogenase family)
MSSADISMAEKTVKRFGPIDILINNAAKLYGTEIVPFYRVEAAGWDPLMAVNVKG